MQKDGVDVAGRAAFFPRGLGAQRGEHQLILTPRQNNINMKQENLSMMRTVRLHAGDAAGEEDGQDGRTGRDGQKDVLSYNLLSEQIRKSDGNANANAKR